MTLTMTFDLDLEKPCMANISFSFVCKVAKFIVLMYPGIAYTLTLTLAFDLENRNVFFA